jgi:predicted DNA binding CopG/RHH family protein
MRKEYDFSNSIKNPYSKKLKKQISLNVEIETIEYFKELSQKTGLPYQTLINSYLTNCAVNHIEPSIQWGVN